MRTTYEVMFGEQGVDRDHESFNTRKQAERFAEKMVEAGKEKVFLDIFTEDRHGDRDFSDFVSYPPKK